MAANDKISKLAKQREALRKQALESHKKVEEYENKLATQIGRIALENNLDQLGETKLIAAFKAIAKEHNIAA